MKRFLAIALAATVGIFAYTGSASAVSVGDYTGGEAANGIGGSRHNLGAMGVHVIAAETTEICVFCHTPHHGTTNAPLWNKGLPAGPFTAYGTTVAGTTVGAPGGATLACLSCHDGVSTLDTLINAPGKGNGGSNNKTATDFNWTFTEDGTSKPDNLTSTRLGIGTDLSDDHPVSVTYTAGKASLRSTSTNLSTIDLTDGLASTNDNIAQNLWAIGGSIDSGSATIADLLRGSSKVECSSCHDPHFSNKTWDEVESTWGGEADADGLFLRRVGGNTGSGVCRTCHDK